MIALVLYLVLLGGLGIVFVAAVSSVREAIRQRARLQGVLIALGMAVGSLLLIWAILI